MLFVTYRNIFFGIIGALSLVCVGALLVWGLAFGIEFTGGTLVSFHYTGTQPSKSVLEEKLAGLGYGSFSLRQSGDTGYMLRMRDLSQTEYSAVEKILAEDAGSGFVMEQRSTVGPVIGGELKNKALVAIVLVVLCIMLYVAIAFRGVAGEKEHNATVSSWTYGIVAVFVLVHDLLIPIGTFAILGHFLGAEVDVLIVVGLLSILVNSVNDAIVIFDRVRENLRKDRERRAEEPFANIVGRSLKETYARSLNTSLTVLIVTLTLLFIGGKTTMYFALTLVAGVIAGTYSSIALAAPLLVTLEARNRKKKGM